MAAASASDLDADSDLVYDEERHVLDLDEDKEVIPYTYEMASYGADYPVDAIITRLEKGDIQIPTFGWKDPSDKDRVGFQRGFVWSKPQSDKFIESLLLGLPVPGIFLVKQNDGILLVLDGHQRLKTLQSFYKGIISGKEYKLGKVQERFSGLGYDDLDSEDRRRLDDSIIHATIVRQEVPEEDESSVYQIFERLNSGGTVLQPQEIRVALYNGPFVTLLDSLNDTDDWRELYGNKSRRLKDMELILRFFALYYFADQYNSPMKSFLNRYMSTNRKLEAQGSDELTSLFLNTVSTILGSIGPKAFRPSRAVNAAVLDAVMVGVAHRLTSGPIQYPKQIVSAYNSLLQDADFTLATSRATANEDQVMTRLSKAVASFGTVA